MTEIIDNLQARIEEAARHGWFGEVQGLRVSLEAARLKLADAERNTRTSATGPVLLGLPITARADNNITAVQARDTD
ncbi:hypothetical protein ACIRRA_40570 [Nocardia sp. NPDC101769]|uniref:hypothetical protein n=1 Tax=Nocardia sp. NPDC101769 TaxID=3364333 RepID=UPI0038013FB3